jgi:hypothetical protein
MSVWIQIDPIFVIYLNFPSYIEARLLCEAFTVTSCTCLDTL